MKIPTRNTIAALLLAALSCPLAAAEPPRQSSPEKRPPSDPSGGRGNSDATTPAQTPEDGPDRPADKPGSTGLPQGGRGNDGQPMPEPRQEQPAATEEEDRPSRESSERRARRTNDGYDQADRAENKNRSDGTATNEASRMSKPDEESVDRIVASWPERPRLGARTLISKYGPPDSATDEMLVWRDQGSFKRICVSKEEHQHDFPKPHTDFMEHTVSYQVPVERAGEITKFDGSVTFDRTQGELSARCDMESHNILALNLAHEIATGELDARQAREKFGEVVVKETAGEKPEYVASLQFEPTPDKATDTDSPTIPGSPQRATADTGEKSGDAKVLGMIVAVDESEIAAASVAASKKLSAEVADYAEMIHKSHGKNLAKTLDLGKEIEVVPAETSEVTALREKHAGELSAVVALDDEEFEEKFVDMMVEGHSEVLEKIDNELLKEAKDEQVINHLRETREEVNSHLDAARKLQTAQR